MNPEILKKVVVGYIVAVPILLVLYVIQFTGIKSATETHRRIASGRETIATADSLETQLTDARSALNEYLATNKTPPLTKFQKATAALKDSTTRLLSLTKADTAQQSRAKAVDTGVQTCLDLFQKSIDLWTKQGPVPSALGDFDAQGEKQAGEIRAGLAAIRKYESDHLPGWLTFARASIERVNILAPISGMLGIWLVLVAALLMYRDARQRTWKGIERRIHSGVVETLPFGICVVDEQGLIFFTNPAQENLFGYEPGGLIGRHLTALHNAPRGEGDDFFDAALKQLGESGEWRGDFPGRKKNGTVVNCVSQAVTMDFGGRSYRVFLTGSQGVEPQVQQSA